MDTDRSDGATDRAALALLDGDARARLIRLFSDDVSARLVMMRAAIEVGEHGVAHRMAHAIRGAASYLGEDALVGICREVEASHDRTAIALLIERIEREASRIALPGDAPPGTTHPMNHNGL